MAVHVRRKFLYISLPLSVKQQLETIKFCVFWRTYATTANILDFLMELIAGITDFRPYAPTGAGRLDYIFSFGQVFRQMCALNGIRVTKLENKI